MTNSITAGDEVETSETYNQPVSIPVTIAKDDIEGASASSMYLVSNATGSKYLSANSEYATASSESLSIAGTVLGDKDVDVGVIIGGKVVDVIKTNNLSFKYDISSNIDVPVSFVVYSPATTNYNVGPTSYPIVTKTYKDVFQDKYVLLVSLTNMAADSGDSDSGDIQDDSLAVSLDDSIAFVSLASDDSPLLSTVSVDGGGSDVFAQTDEQLTQIKYDLNGNIYGIGVDSQTLYRIDADGNITSLDLAINFPRDRRFDIHPRGAYLISTVKLNNPLSGEDSTTLYLHDLNDESNSRIIPFPEGELVTVDHMSLAWSDNANIVLIKHTTDGHYIFEEYGIAQLIADPNGMLVQKFLYSSDTYIGNVVSDRGYAHEVVFECADSAGYTNLCRVNFDTNEIETIIQGEYNVSHANFSYDGLYVSADINATVDGKEMDELVLYSFNTQELHFLVRGERPAPISSDSGSLAYLSHDITGTWQINLVSLGDQLEAQIGDADSLSIFPNALGVSFNTSYALLANGGSLPYTFSILSGSGEVNAMTGLVTAKEESGELIVRVTDSVGNTSDSVLTMYPAIQIQNIETYVIHGGSLQIQVSGGVAPYHYTIIEGGGTISDTGLYTAPGYQDNIVIQVSDANGNEVNYHIDVGDENGVLDFSYNGNGMTSSHIDENGLNVVSSMDFDSTGAVIVGANIGEIASADIGITRFLASGASDENFGTSGSVVFDLEDTHNFLRGLAIQPDDKIIVCGGRQFGPGDGETLLARFNTDGTLDDTFGENGVVNFRMGGFVDTACHDVVIQENGQIIFGGYVHTGVQTDFAIMRLNSDGSFDSSFGVGGLVQVDFFGEFDDMNAITLSSDGKIVGAGSSKSGGTKDFALVRLNADGGLDASFGVGGKVVTNASGGFFNDEINDILVQPDGSVIAAGVVFDGINQNMTLAKYTSSGTLDLSFDMMGILVMPTGTGDSFGYSLARQMDGKILVSGSAKFPSTNSIVRRINSDGTIDSSFADSGLLALDLDDYDSVSDMQIQSDGRVVCAIAGGDFDGIDFTDTWIYVVRFWP